MKKRTITIYLIPIIVLMLILFIDLFIKIEYSSSAVEHSLDSINKNLNILIENSDTLSVEGKSFFNSYIIKLNDTTNHFLSDRFIAFLFTTINIFLISLGLYFINSFKNIKDEINNDWRTLQNEILTTSSLQDKSHHELLLFGITNKMYAKYLVSKSVNSPIKDVEFDSNLRYILKSYVRDINKTIEKMVKENVSIDEIIYGFCLDVLNEMKSIPNQNYKGKIPEDIQLLLSNAISNLKMVNIKKKFVVDVK